MVDRPLIPAMRRLLLVASLLVLAVGIPLMLRPTETADYFSWTIQPPLTAAFLGSAYWASFLLEFEASRRHTWDYARIAVPAVFVFTVLTLIATLNNLEKFHFGDPGHHRVDRHVGLVGRVCGRPDHHGDHLGASDPRARRRRPANPSHTDVVPRRRRGSRVSRSSPTAR